MMTWYVKPASIPRPPSPRSCSNETSSSHEAVTTVEQPFHETALACEIGCTEVLRSSNPSNWAGITSVSRASRQSLSSHPTVMV